ncbi:hypothetical protein Glove_230g27 [Diversispora epigaea]|uniref:Protein kinase domain-containing protein n=1 Tax=Diversispora epigaea TaxID=1348612 RepID=A0A397ICG7_9GLOM|nr:hypothetical protein Glove_230g27 [Diversispora epigaea]
MAFKIFNLAVDEIIDISSFNSSSLKNYTITTRKLVSSRWSRCHQEILKTGLRLKIEEKVFELYLKSAEKGNIATLSNVGFCYENVIGIAIYEPMDSMSNKICSCWKNSCKVQCQGYGIDRDTENDANTGLGNAFIKDTNEKEWETWMDNLIIEDAIQKENIPFYQYSEFENVKLIGRNVCEAIFKTSQKTVALKCVSLNDEATLDNLINEIKKHRKLEIHDSILKLYGITKQENTKNYMIVFEYANNGSLPITQTNEKEWETWMDNLIIEDAIQKENIPFYQYSEFENVKLIGRNVCEAIFKTSQKTVALKCVSLNDEATLDNLINEIKKHRKLEIHDSILKLYGITKQENTKNYMIVFEYANNGSLRQYLKSNFRKLDWNAKLNLAKQIANILMYLHSNDIIYGRLNSENILIHNGNIKLNVFGITKIISDSLEFLTNTLGPMQYMDPQYLELFNITGKKSSDIFGLGIILWEISSGNPPFEMESLSNIDLLNNIAKGKRETTISGTPRKYKEIYTDCWKHNGNSRPDIFQVVKNLSEIIISDASIEFETPQSQPYNVTDVKLENLNMKNEKPEIKPDLSFDVTTEVNGFINDLIEFFINIRKNQSKKVQPIMIKNYISEHKKNPVEIFYEMIRHPSYYWFTSLIGFFYQYGIGTVTDNQMAFKFFNSAANKIIDTSSFNPPSLRKLYNINKEISILSLATMYLYGLGVEKNVNKAFQINSKVADEGSIIALNSMAYYYQNGFGVEKNHEKAFEFYLKAAEKGNVLAQSNAGGCYKNGIGIAIDNTKAFQWCMKSSCAGNIDAMCKVGYSYENGKDMGNDIKEAFKWYLKAAEKGHDISQCNVGNCYKNGYGINIDQVKAFEWYKKSAENDYAKGQYMLGKCFYEGFGTKKDIIKAIHWLNKAKENGETYANELLKKIIK